MLGDVWRIENERRLVFVIVSERNIAVEYRLCLVRSQARVKCFGCVEGVR
jgi:hypothetical protein